MKICLLRPLALLLALRLLASAAFAAATSPFRLSEIFALRFVKDTQGATIIDQGTFNTAGEFKHALYRQFAGAENIPLDALNVNLLPVSLWPAYDALGHDALANFNLTATLVDGTSYFVITAAEHPRLEAGSLVNLSTRGTVGSGGEPLLGGFVIADHPRRVLIRGIGPTLSSFGVVSPLANPAITVHRAGDAARVGANDDWGSQANRTEIEAVSTSVGAFPLAPTSTDAALLLELPPGVYTVNLSSVDATAGVALLEIYTLP